MITPRLLFLLETFYVPALYVATLAVLSLRFVMHVGSRDGLWRRCVARCSIERCYALPHTILRYLSFEIG